MISEKQLLELKEDITTSKTTVSELTGQEKAIRTQLKTDWKCKTIEEGQKKLNKLDQELNNIDDQIETLSRELEGKYGN